MRRYSLLCYTHGYFIYLFFKWRLIETILAYTNKSQKQKQMSIKYSLNKFKVCPFFFTSCTTNVTTIYSLVSNVPVLVVVVVVDVKKNHLTPRLWRFPARFPTIFLWCRFSNQWRRVWDCVRQKILVYQVLPTP